MPIPIYQVSAFTDNPFAGNPAAVCVLSTPASQSWMQDLAMQMNIAETAFLFEDTETWKLRWFTPTVEVPLCGHATLASAHALWQTGRCKTASDIVFDTKSGKLTCRMIDGQISMDFPSKPPTPSAAPDELTRALGAAPVAYGTNDLDALFELADEEQVRGLSPDFAALRAISGLRGVIATSRSADGRYDFVSRFFAPAAGIDEDPVTGSAHCCLAPYWSAKLGKLQMTGYQASRRGGVVGVRINEGRVVLLGNAVMVFKGELTGQSEPPRA